MKREMNGVLELQKICLWVPTLERLRNSAVEYSDGSGGLRWGVCWVPLAALGLGGSRWHIGSLYTENVIGSLYF